VGAFILFKRGQAPSGSATAPTVIPAQPGGAGAISVPYNTIPTSTLTPAAAKPPLVFTFGVPGRAVGANGIVTWTPPNDGTYVWRLTPQGEAEYAARYGGQWPGGIYPASAPIPVWGAYTWQSAKLPDGTTLGDYTGGSGQSVAGGVGGAGPSRGSSSANLMAHQHPQLHQVVRYPHFHLVGGVGGPAGGTVQSLARQAGVHPARLIALNSHHLPASARELTSGPSSLDQQLPRGALVRIA
jgi:hypothetical protein